MESTPQSNQLASALICLEKGWFVFPLLERSKQPNPKFAPHGFKDASNDPEQIKEWWKQAPNSNIGIDLGRSNLTVLDFDKGVPPPELSLPETLQVTTSRGTHVYFAGVSQQGNMFFNHIHVGEIKSAGGYVLGPFSTHPSGATYEVLVRAPLAPLPLDIVERLRPKSKVEIQKNEHDKVPHGFIHPWLVSQAGKLRNLGLDIDTLELALVKLAEENCEPPLDLSKVRQVARSFEKYPPGTGSGDILFTQQPAQQATNIQPEPVEVPAFTDEPFPMFPSWVMEGTSVYEGFVKPYCAVNSRISYFMWLPAMAALLNYIGPKIKIQEALGPRPFRGSIYMVLIGRKGKTNKSSSVNDALAYFNYCGCLTYSSRDMKNAEGRTLVWTVGSPEGLGIDMQKTNCKNAIMFYDELSQLVSKVSIDSSQLASSLLTMYEAGRFANGVKSQKETYALEADTYCTSLIACTTDKKYAELWSKLAGSDTGLDDRFFFVYQPQNLPTPRVKTYVNTVAGAVETSKLIRKALDKKVYEFDNPQDPRLIELVEIENRLADRAEKWALAIAVDRGLDSVDEECIERACAIVKYEMAVKKYLKSYEATTREGQIQLDVRRTLEMNKGRMLKRDFLRKMNYTRHGTSLWNQAYGGLIKAGVLREEGAGTKTDPTYVQLLVKRETDDE